MMDTIRNLIKRALVTKGGDDDLDFPIQQVGYFGKVGDSEIVFPYGVHANLPKDSILVLFALNAEDDSRAAIGGMPKKRPRNLPEGEVVFYHPITQSKIHFKNNGDIEIDTVGNEQNGGIILNTNFANISVINDATIIIDGDADLEIAGTFNLICPTTNWVGNLNITGTVTIDGINHNTHVHGGVATGAGQTGGPQ